ncbi:MAG TPA: hypothetical protein VKU60_01565, partial [Chloroflexota bacterium]|nr:hypothetical protein [Chloroflexota bacterium]
MRAALRVVTARLVVGHLNGEEAAELLTIIEPRDKPVTFALAEPDGLRLTVAAGVGAEGARSEPVRCGKLVLETVANEAAASVRRDVCDSIVDGLRIAHQRLGPDGLELMPRGSAGVGFCSASMVEGVVQLVIVPPAQVFVVHQGVALSVPESGETGRGIWMRDDLRTEIFAGVGGMHEPDIRVYEATAGPGDTLVLASSDLARMLTEDDVQLAVTYEEAATAADRLKQLAVQRGVEAGLALVVEIAGSLEEAEPAGPSGSARPLPATSHIQMPPIGSIFNTAREWLLETVDRVQASSGWDASAPIRDLDGEDIPWPARPRRGAWRTDQPMRHIAMGKAARTANGQETDDQRLDVEPNPDQLTRYGQLSVESEPATPAQSTQTLSASVRVHRPDMPAGQARVLAGNAQAAFSTALTAPRLHL